MDIKSGTKVKINLEPLPEHWKGFVQVRSPGAAR